MDESGDAGGSEGVDGTDGDGGSGSVDSSGSVDTSGAVETVQTRPCPFCGASMDHRHCKYVCPQHGVVMDCADTFFHR